MKNPMSPLSRVAATDTNSPGGARSLAAHSVLCPILTFALGAVFSGSSAAQIPENCAVVGTLQTAGGKRPGKSGLFLVTLPSSTNPVGVVPRV